MFFFYLLKCNDNTLYSGSTNDLLAREAMHNSGKGSVYVRTHGGGKIVYHETLTTRGDAMRREIEVKKWSRVKKEKMMQGLNSRSMERFIQEITKKAGASILKKFGKVGVKYTKADATDVVTEADLISNKIITQAIKKTYPNHGIISEETGEYQSNAEYVWIIDPLDGTRNFATHTPLFSVVIGLARNNVMQLATIYNPCTNELVFAKKGHGSFLNGKKIVCSNQKDWERSWGVISSKISKKTLKTLRKLTIEAEKGSFWLSALGSFSVGATYVATGRRDWQISHNGSIWDYAGPSLILQEAGCLVNNMEGKTWTLTDKEMVISNKYLHKKLFSILKNNSN